MPQTPHLYIILIGPDAFFLFPGKSCAAIALPPMKPWPVQNGFSLSCWFRLDPLNNLHIETDKPYLYCLRTSKGIGYSGHFVGGCLVITALKSKGKGFQQCVAVEFNARRWHHVVIVHEWSRWRSSSIRYDKYRMKFKIKQISAPHR